MATIYSIGDNITLKATFISYDSSDDSESVAVPDSVSGFIFKLNSTTKTYDSFDTFTPNEISPGVYTHVWNITENGKFKIQFLASFGSGQESSNIRYMIIGPVSTSTSLGSNVVYNFLGILDPLYLNPEIVLTYFSSADLAEVTELINWYSLEIKALLNVTTITEVTQLMQDFILASVLCDLSKIYTFGGGLSGFTSSESFTLGDLQVKSSSGPSSSTSNGFNRSGVGSWCELAALLRQELTATNNNLKAVVKGSNFRNPIPCRALKRVD
jgi:hypothetical protein